MFWTRLNSAMDATLFVKEQEVTVHLKNQWTTSFGKSSGTTLTAKTHLVMMMDTKCVTECENFCRNILHSLQRNRLKEFQLRGWVQSRPTSWNRRSNAYRTVWLKPRKLCREVCSMLIKRRWNIGIVVMFSVVEPIVTIGQQADIQHAETLGRNRTRFRRNSTVLL